MPCLIYMQRTEGSHHRKLHTTSGWILKAVSHKVIPFLTDWFKSLAHEEWHQQDFAGYLLRAIIKFNSILNLAENKYICSVHRNASILKSILVISLFPHLASYHSNIDLTVWHLTTWKITRFITNSTQHNNVIVFEHSVLNCIYAYYRWPTHTWYAHIYVLN